MCSRLSSTNACKSWNVNSESIWQLSLLGTAARSSSRDAKHRMCHWTMRASCHRAQWSSRADRMPNLRGWSYIWNDRHHHYNVDDMRGDAYIRGARSRRNRWASERSALGRRVEQRRSERCQFRLRRATCKRPKSDHGIESLAKDDSINPGWDYKAAAVIDSTVEVETKVCRARDYGWRSDCDKRR